MLIIAVKSSSVSQAFVTLHLPFPVMKTFFPSFYSFTPQDVKEFFEKAGVPLKVERGNRVFPQSDHSSDIIRALERELKKAGAKIHLHTAVQEIVKKPVTDSANTLESEATLQN